GVGGCGGGDLVVARDGEWCRGSDRSGGGEYFWVRRKRSSENFFDGGGWWPASGGGWPEIMEWEESVCVC
nr:hypothetical protein [Tanacetum cinerariifolium]